MKQSDWAAHRCLGGHVTQHRPVTGPGESAVSDQGHIVAQSLAHDGAGHRQHLPHAGAADGAFVADNHDVARDYLLSLYRRKGILLLVEDPGRSLKYLFLVPGHLDDRSIRRQVAVYDGQAAGGTARFVHWVDHGLVFNGFHGFQVFAQGLAGDCHGVTVKQPRGQ